MGGSGRCGIGRHLPGPPSGRRAGPRRPAAGLYGSRIIRVAAILGVCAAVLAGEAHAETFGSSSCPACRPTTCAPSPVAAPSGCSSRVRGRRRAPGPPRRCSARGVVRNSLRTRRTASPSRCASASRVRARSRRGAASSSSGCRRAARSRTTGGSRSRSSAAASAACSRRRARASPGSSRSQTSRRRPSGRRAGSARSRAATRSPSSRRSTGGSTTTTAGARGRRRWLELALAAVAVVSGTAAVLGAAAFLLANLVLGAVDVPAGRVVRRAVGGGARRAAGACGGGHGPASRGAPRGRARRLPRVVRVDGTAGSRCRRSARRRTRASTGSRTCSRRSC